MYSNPTLLVERSGTKEMAFCHCTDNRRAICFYMISSFNVQTDWSQNEYKYIMNEWSHVITGVECYCMAAMQGENHVLHLIYFWIFLIFSFNLQSDTPQNVYKQSMNGW